MVSIVIGIMGIYVIAGYVTEANVIQRIRETDLSINTPDPVYDTRLLNDMQPIYKIDTMNENNDFPKMKVLHRISETDFSRNTPDPVYDTRLSNDLQKQYEIDTMNENNDFPRLEVLPIENYTDSTITYYTYETRIGPSNWGIAKVVLLFLFLINTCCFVGRRKFCNNKRTVHIISIAPSTTDRAEDTPDHFAAEETGARSNDEVPAAPPPSYDEVVIDRLPTYEELIANKTKTVTS